MVRTAVVPVCGLAEALGAAAGLSFGGYAALQTNFETPANRDSWRARRTPRQVP